MSERNLSMIWARRAASAGIAALAFAAALAGGPAAASPVALSSDADVAAFAQRIKAYAEASRVRWVVAAPTQADADALLANIAGRLTAADYDLLQRVKAEPLSAAPDIGLGVKTPLGWMEPQIGQAPSARACSWQVWVADPALPSEGPGPANVPLAPNDRLPVGPAATFRIGYTGLLQSKVYAFGETKPGAIRDLASAPDANIPVESGAGSETIILAMSRQPTPYFESIRSALASSLGQRRDLGLDYALRRVTMAGADLGMGRGIGSNIQSVPMDMVAPKRVERTAMAASQPQPGELMETCEFSLTPAQEAAQ